MSNSSASRLKLVVYGGMLANPSVGLGVHCLNLVRALQKMPGRDWDFRVLVPPTVQVGSLGLNAESVHVFQHASRTGHPFLDETIASQSAGALAAREYPDAIFHAPSLFWSIRAPRRRVVTIHDANHRVMPLYLGRKFVRRQVASFAERYARSCEQVLTVSHFAKQQIAEYLDIPASRIHVNYNWVPPEFSAEWTGAQIEQVREKYRLPPRFWLYLGGYDYRKNVDFLITAYALARQREPHLPPLVLGGEIRADDKGGIYCDTFGAIRRANLQPGEVMMPGRFETVDLPGIYRAASLLVYPSRLEGFGLPPAEAMAVGTPVLVSNSSSLPEVVRDSASRFDAANLDSLTEKLGIAASDPARFRQALPSDLTESAGIRRYCELLGLSPAAHG